MNRWTWMDKLFASIQFGGLSLDTKEIPPAER